jgi:hypothetical protein
MQREDKMLAYYGDLAGEAERRKDEMAQAERHRLSREVPKLQSSRTARYQRWMARLGDLMVAWGCQLQTRFAVETNTGT